MKTIISFFLSLSLVLTPAMARTDNGGYDFVGKQILILATSSVGSSILTQCGAAFKIPSVSLFMGGSLVNIVYEVLGAEAESDNHKKKLKQLELTEEAIKSGGDFQLETLVQRKKDEEQARDFIKKRMLWMSAVAVIYGTALGLSIAEEAYSNAAGASAGAASCAAVAAALSAPCVTGYAACYAGHYAACTGTMASGSLAAKAAIPTTTGPAIATSTCTGLATYSPGCAAYSTAYHAGAYAGCINAVPAKAFSWKGALSMAYGFGASSMEGGQISQYGSLLMSLMSAAVPAVGAAVPMAYNYPLARTFTLGALEVLVGTVISGLIVRKNKTEKNIELLDRLITEFKGQTDDDGGMGEGDGNGGAAQAGIGGGAVVYEGDPSNLTALPKVPPTKKCLSSSYELNASACQKPFQMKSPNLSGFGTTLPGLNKASVLTTDLVNSMANGNFDKADVLAGELGSLAGNISKTNKKLMEDYNKKLKAEGKKGIDFDKGIKEQVAAMQSQLENASKSSGVSLASLSNEDSPKEQGSEDSEGKKVLEGESPNVATIPVPSPGIDNMNFSSDYETSAEFENSGRMASLSDRLEEFEATEGDVVTDPGVSIFKQVSNRYLLNYEKVLNRKELPSPTDKKE